MLSPLQWDQLCILIPDEFLTVKTPPLHNGVTYPDYTYLPSTPLCTSLLSCDTQLTSGMKHPSGDHYKLEVMTYTLQSPHLCLFLQWPCAVYPPLPLTLKKKKRNQSFIMFPSAQAHGLRYKVILSDCRKQSQEMEMHCAASSATSGYLFGQIFLHGNPLPSITLGIPESMPGSWKNKPAVSCNLLRLQGGITSLPSHPTGPPLPPQRSSSKQKLVGNPIS